MSERPGPDDPAYWPEADEVGGHWITLPGGLQGVWVVLGLPPEPFLGERGITADRIWPRAVYGPAGTVWEFRLADVVERLFNVDPRGGATLLKFVLRKLGRIGPTGVPLFWVIPNTYPAPGGPMRYISSTVVGKIGLDESVAHTLKWRTAAENAPMSFQQVHDFGVLLRDRWIAFMRAQLASGGGQVEGFIPTQLEYTEVRAAYVEQTVPDQRKPPYLVPTQFIPFAPGSAKGQSAGGSLPYEVANVLSFNTNFRGPRFRGRMYLGPLGINILGQEGNFQPPVVRSIAKAFWEQVVIPIETAGYEFHVVSRKFVTSARIIGVRSGQVPDSMRSRRRSRPEAYEQAAGAVLGSVAG